MGRDARRDAGTARRVSAPARADRHAGRAVRDHDHGRPGAAAVAPAAGAGKPERPVAGRSGRTRARRHRHRPRDRRGPDRANRGLRRAASAQAPHGPGRAGHGLLHAARRRLHGRGVPRHRAFRAGQQRAGAGVRAGGGRRRLRHPDDPRRRARAVSHLPPACSPWAASTGCCTICNHPGIPCRCRPASPARTCSPVSRWPPSASSRCGWPRRSPGTPSGCSR